MAEIRRKVHNLINACDHGIFKQNTFLNQNTFSKLLVDMLNILIQQVTGFRQPCRMSIIFLYDLE